MAWDDLPKDWTPVPVGRGIPVPKLERVVVLREKTCYCGKTESVCIEENGADCRHPHAAAHMWGD